jgi:hypothetical protein
VSLPSQVKGTSLYSVYNGTVSPDSPNSFYITYNVSSYGFAAISMEPSDLVDISIQTAVSGTIIKGAGEDYWFTDSSAIVMDPTEAECENPDESTDGGVNCLFLVTVAVASEYHSSVGEVSFDTMGLLVRNSRLPTIR